MTNSDAKADNTAKFKTSESGSKIKNAPNTMPKSFFLDGTCAEFARTLKPPWHGLSAKSSVGATSNTEGKGKPGCYASSSYHNPAYLPQKRIQQHVENRPGSIRLDSNHLEIRLQTPPRADLHL
jgi:hypothetical protein